MSQQKKGSPQNGAQQHGTNAAAAVGATTASAPAAVAVASTNGVAHAGNDKTRKNAAAKQVSGTHHTCGPISSAHPFSRRCN